MGMCYAHVDIWKLCGRFGNRWRFGGRRDTVFASLVPSLFFLSARPWGLESYTLAVSCALVELSFWEVVMWASRKRGTSLSGHILGLSVSALPVFNSKLLVNNLQFANHSSWLQFTDYWVQFTGYYLLWFSPWNGYLPPRDRLVVVFDNFLGVQTPLFYVYFFILILFYFIWFYFILFVSCIFFILLVVVNCNL